MAIKISVNSTNPITVASLRLIIGSIFLFTYYKFKGLKENLSIKILLFIFLIGLIGNFIPFSLISWSEQYIQSNTAGLLLSVAPILTLILSHFFTKDDIFTLRKFLSILIGITGVLFIIGFDEFLNIIKESISLGANVVGGCCGVSPKHINLINIPVK